MIYQIVILAIISLFTINLAANLRSIRIRPDTPPLDGAPLVSILVPARNEEANIAGCVNSLRAQDYPHLEILVLDDESTDRTAEIVASIAGSDSRVRLLHGAPLPEGWAGKPHACHQLSLAARGEFLLFTDADTTHAPHMLSTVLPVAQHSGASIISGFPRQIVRTLREKAAIPIVFFLLVSSLPISIARLRHTLPRSFMIGQFILFPRSEYARIGGHESVKARILEDMFLGSEVRKRGGRQLTLNLSSVVCCRMYRDRASLWEGFVKWGYSFSAVWPKATPIISLCLLVAFSSPFLSIVAVLVLTPEQGPILLMLAVIQVCVILGGRLACDYSLRAPMDSALLTPWGIAFFLLAMQHGAILRLAGRPVNWKQRRYGGRTMVT